MLVLTILLIVIKLPLGNQSAAIVGFPMAILAAASLLLVLLVLAAPEVPARREEAVEMRLSFICNPAVGVDSEDGRVLAMNDLAADLFGPREELVGERAGKLAGDVSSRNIEDEALTLTSPDYVGVGDFSMRLGEGNTRELPVIARRVNIANHDTVVLVFRADEVDHALVGFARMQERLMSNISHELRTPLNVVMGFSELLTAGTLGEMGSRQLDGVAEIHTGGRRMLHIIDDVLDIGRARNYGTELDPHMLDLSEMIARVQDLVSGTARQEKVALAFAPQDDLPAVNADERTFKQLLYHLLLGAVDRSNAGESVQLAVASVEDAVEVRVTSIGQALSPDDIAALDSPPERLPIGAEGLPAVLGMKLCAGLATHLGVTLSHSSSKGSVTMSFALPVA
jgi:signal transduction histidine kinase